MREAKTKTIQAMSQASMAVRASAWVMGLVKGPGHPGHLWRVGLDGVEDVDEDEEDGDEEAHPAGDALRVDKEGDPADDDEEAGGEVVGDHVEGHLPRQHQLKPSDAAIQVIFYSLLREMQYNESHQFKRSK